MSETQQATLHIPPGSRSLDDPTYHIQLRLGIQGLPGWGKTFAATTFPNPIFVSYERGLISHMGRKDIIEIPFYDDHYIDGIHKRESEFYVELGTGAQKLRPANRKEALIKWLLVNASKFSKNQTLIIDNSTGVEASYHSWYRANVPVSQKGEEDKWAQWRWKIEFFSDLMQPLKSVSCNVIYIAHETPDRDKSGELNGMLRPLLTGQFGDQLVSHFTDWYRAVCVTKPSSEEEMKKFIDGAAGGNKAYANELLASTPPDIKCVYLWQTQSDSKVACKTSLIGAPKFVVANSSVFQKYKRTNKSE